MDIQSVLTMNKKDIESILATKLMGWIPTKGNWWDKEQKYGVFNCSPDDADQWTFPSPQGVEWKGAEISVPKQNQLESHGRP